MPEDDQYDRNMWHVLTKLIKCYVADGSTYANFNLIVTFSERSTQNSVNKSNLNMKHICV